MKSQKLGRQVFRDYVFAPQHRHDARGMVGIAAGEESFGVRSSFDWLSMNGYLTLRQFGLDAALQLTRDSRPGVHQSDAVSHHLADQWSKERIVGATQGQRVCSARYQRGGVALDK